MIIGRPDLSWWPRATHRLSGSAAPLKALAHGEVHSRDIDSHALNAAP